MEVAVSSIAFSLLGTCPVALQEIFGEDRVGLRTGDVSINRDAPIVVMTTEILRNLTYRAILGQLTTDPATNPDIAAGLALEEVGLTILDEMHYLGHPDRGSVWEELVINSAPHMQLLAMSATIRNAREIGAWIEEIHGSCATLLSGWRPVPLEWLFAWDEGPKAARPMPSRLEPLLDELAAGADDAGAMHRRARINGDLRGDERNKARAPAAFGCVSLSGTCTGSWFAAADLQLVSCSSWLVAEGSGLSERALSRGRGACRCGADERASRCRCAA
jgi:superfamily II RNA helicase